MARQESGNSRLKGFKILEDKFRTMGKTNRTREDRHRTALGRIIPAHMKGKHKQCVAHKVLFPFIQSLLPTSEPEDHC